jgi:hypothetical protein
MFPVIRIASPVAKHTPCIRVRRSVVVYDFTAGQIVTTQEIFSWTPPFSSLPMKRSLNETLNAKR